MIRIYDIGTDSLIELTQEKFDRIECIGVSDSKRKHTIKIISNMSIEEFDEVFKNGLYDLVWKYKK